MPITYTYVFIFDLILEDETINQYQTFEAINVNDALDAFDAHIIGKTYRLYSMYRE